MPNHIINVIRVRDDENLTKLAQIANLLKPAGEPLGYVDFNHINPMPEALNIESSTKGMKGLEQCRKFIDAGGILSEKQELYDEKTIRSLVKDYDPEAFKLGKTYYENIQKYGCPTWYEWCVENWGTKWNAYSCEPLTPESTGIIFSTAWDGVPKIVSSISKQFPQLHIEYKWADEDIGHNVGRVVYSNGSIVENNHIKDASKEAFELSAELWNLDLKEMGFSLSADKSTYEYHDPWDNAPKSVEPVKNKTQQKKKSRGDSR
jgi:hypothetical protein